MPSLKVQMLLPNDIYDFYACSLLWDLANQGVEPEDLNLCEFRIREVHKKYLAACKERIRAEAKYLGIGDLESISIATMLDQIAEMVVMEFQSEQNAENMMRGGQFNMANALIDAAKISGMDMSQIDTARFGLEEEPEPVPQAGVDIDWFDGAKARGGRAVKDPKWAIIAKAYLAIEKAQEVRQIIRAVDALNDLQHNSFHILIDLQTGRMLGDRATDAASHNDARQTLQDVLDFKQEARGLRELIPKVSSEIKELIKKYRFLA